VPDEDRDVIVYCKDADCDASPKAAKRMEQLGYRNVFDYAAGKEDWKIADLPEES
jgi:rhodanese-related sulfurtransferase